MQRNNKQTKKKTTTNNPTKKWMKNLNRHLSKEDTDYQQAHEKMLNITDFKKNTNQHYTEVILTSVRVAIIKKYTKK